MERLQKQAWERRVEEHFTRAHEFAQAARERASRRERHPVYDFLTQYYPFSLGRFEKWHPGLGLTLEEANADRFPAPKYAYDHAGAATVNLEQLREKDATRHEFTLQLLEVTQSRPGLHSCFGLHEWAMVYTGADVRHKESAPLRLTQKEIDEVVHARPLVCTHFDAYRFFSPDAKPLNKHQPTLHDRLKLEQPGCIHANMDLYKWASKTSPWVGSDLQWACFQLALKARTIDMRASPYDLSEWGYAPICIETEEGRADYLHLQKELEEEGKVLRAELMAVLRDLLKNAEIAIAL